MKLPALFLLILFQCLLQSAFAVNKPKTPPQDPRATMAQEYLDLVSSNDPEVIAILLCAYNDDQYKPGQTDWKCEIGFSHQTRHGTFPDSVSAKDPCKAMAIIYAKDKCGRIEGARNCGYTYDCE